MVDNLNPEFAVNPEQRLACMLLLDTSGSMAGERIELLNKGLRSLVGALREDGLARKRVDLAIMTFNDSVEMVHDFRAVDQWDDGFPELEADGVTNMGAALVDAVRRIKDRKRDYNANGVPSYRPWLFILTDGAPTDSTEAASTALREAQKNGHVTVFPVGVGSDVDLDGLKKISQAEPLRLNEARWNEMFVWLTQSLKSASRSKPGEQFQLPAANNWGSVTA
jgi:uncharacterized protein YegL